MILIETPELRERFETFGKTNDYELLDPIIQELRILDKAVGHTKDMRVLPNRYFALYILEQYGKWSDEIIRRP